MSVYFDEEKKRRYRLALFMFVGVLAVAFVLLFGSLAHAQVDVYVPVSQSNYSSIASNLTWNASGPGGLTNNFVMVPPTPDSSLCLYIQNTDLSLTHGINFTVFATGNPSVKTFTGNTSGWAATNAVTSTLAVNSTQSFYLVSRSAARIAVQMAGTGAGASASLFGVWTQQSACSLPISSVVDGGGSIFSLVQCDHFANFLTGPGPESDVIVATPNAAPYTRIVVCNIYASGPPATSGSNFSEFFGSGTSGNCVVQTHQGPSWTWPNNTTTQWGQFNIGGNIGSAYIVDSLEPLCYGHAGTGSQEEIYVQYALR